jgi:hypothetical protein
LNSDKMTQWQKDALAGFAEQQESYLTAIAAWRKTLQTATPPGAAPTPPLAPTMDSAPTPSDVMDANQAFMNAVFKQQQEFLEKLTKTLRYDG